MLNMVVFISYHKYWDFWELDSESCTLLIKEKTAQKSLVGLQLGGFGHFLVQARTRFYSLLHIFTC